MRVLWLMMFILVFGYPLFRGDPVRSSARQTGFPRSAYAGARVRLCDFG
jgi:hypothetical protein